ncbi:MAG: PASTA domain-containing protein [Bacteroidota bacterium]|nr:PASTA domain-containing protein [Bacteroidota bacterium]
MSWLSSYTTHGESVSVPNFSGIKLAELDNFVSDKHVRYLVIDSIYDTKAAKGVVIKQEPEPDAKVKDNRTIYLYVTSILPPSIQMPKLVDRSLRQAAAMISSYGLKMAAPKFVPDQCANCVLEQMVKGKKIEPGATIPKGTVIQLVVGKGLSDEEVGIPCLYGMTRREALARLSEASLSVGAITFDVPADSAKSIVYRQSPSCGKDNNLNMGGTIDLFLTTDKNKIPANSDTLKTDDEDPL